MMEFPQQTIVKVAVSVPLIGLTLIGFKLQKLKKTDRLTSVSDFIKALPMFYRTFRFMFIESKIKKNAKLKKLGCNLPVHDPSFRLSDHWTCRDTDVIVAVPAKSGTTWCQQMVQQLRVNGNDKDVNFYQDILDVQPWLEAVLGETFGPPKEWAVQPDPAAGPGAFDMDADHVDSDIRCFKSHLTYKALDGLNCKKLYCYRHGVDAMYSGYRFMCEQILEVTDKVTPGNFVTFQTLSGNLTYKNLENLCDFWDHRHDPNIGLFFYDDLKEDHAGSVKRIAELMGIDPKPDLIQKVVEQSTVAYMSADDHHLRFDGLSGISTVKEAVGLDISHWPKVSGQKPPGKLNSMKVSKDGGLGKSSTKKKVIPGRDSVEALYQRNWDKIVLPRTGFATVEEMRSAFKKELSEQ